MLNQPAPLVPGTIQHQTGLGGRSRRVGVFIMKKFLILITVIIVVIGIIVLASQKNTSGERLTVQVIDDKGVFVGDPRLVPTSHQNSKIHPGILQDQKNHEASLRAIDESWEFIRVGDRYSKVGNLQKAADAYKNAYSIGGGSRAVSGLLLAETYEKLGRYDEGIALLDEMIAKPYLSENGIKNANEIRARLVAAKK